MHLNMFYQQRGLTLLEVLVTVIILSMGITGIYRALLFAVDMLDHITNRLYAHILLDNKLVVLQQMFLDNQDIFSLQNHVDSIDINNRRRTFQYVFSVQGVEHVNDLYTVAVRVHWQERNKQVGISRTACLARH